MPTASQSVQEDYEVAAQREGTRNSAGTSEIPPAARDANNVVVDEMKALEASKLRSSYATWSEAHESATNTEIPPNAFGNELLIGAAANKLRMMCAKRFLFSVADIRAHLEEQEAVLGKGGAARVINMGNQNGKTAFHHGCQLRKSAELCELLLSMGANIDATTTRGHTALIYAVGKGRSDTVRLLLSHGANACVRTVTGDTALTMAEGERNKHRIDEDALELLRHAVESAETQERDFTRDAHALEAQREHTRHCRHCQQKLRRESGGSGGLWMSREDREVKDRLVHVLAAAATEGPEALCQALIDAASQCAFHTSAQARRDAHTGLMHDPYTPLRVALSEVSQTGREAVLMLLSASTCERLGRALKAAGGAPYVVNVILDSIIGCFREGGGGGGLEGVSVRDMFERGELSVVMELVWLCKQRTGLGDDDVTVCELMWHKSLEGGGLGKFSKSAAARLAKEAKGYPTAKISPRVAQYLVMLRWAWELRLPGVRGMTERLITHAKERGMAELVHRAVALNPGVYPDCVLGTLQDAARCRAADSSAHARGRPLQLGAHSERKGGDGEEDESTPTPTHVHMDFLSLDIAPVWVCDRYGLQVVVACIEGQLAKEGPVYVGVDCEWTDASTPSVVQVSTVEGLFVIDTKATDANVMDAQMMESKGAGNDNKEGAASAAATADVCYFSLVRKLIKLMFHHPLCRIVGFSFARDIEKLEALLGEEEALAATNVIDLQYLFAASRGLGPGWLPSLRFVCETLLGKSLDKTHQCSDWDARPLSQAQLYYAALDAHVLRAHLLPHLVEDQDL